MTPLRSQSLVYRSLSILDLVARIVNNEDQTALEEFLNRRIFRSAEKSRMRLDELLQSLRAWASKGTWGVVRAHEVADKAYDITVDKFTNLPNPKASDGDAPLPGQLKLKRSGPDCRLYYKAFIDHITRKSKDQPPEGPLEEELKAAQALGRFVRRHFLLSLLEAKRNSNPFWSRYLWSVNERSINLWMPVALKGQQRRKWLEKHIKNPDPTRPLERDRIQGIVNRRLVNFIFVPFDPDRIGQLSDPFSAEKQSNEKFGSSLAHVVAEEKSASINEQRQAIKKLGRKDLKEMILKIFEGAEDGDITDAELARKFGLSKATYSRFAGSRWHKSKDSSLPDLWANTAQVLAMDPDFKETVLAAGAWQQVQAVLKTSEEG